MSKLDAPPPPSMYEDFSYQVHRQSLAAFAGPGAEAGKGKGLLGKLGRQQAELNIDVGSYIVYVHPPPVDSPEEGDETLVEGTVMLSLPKARKFKQLVVNLTARYNLSWPSSSDGPLYEAGVLFERQAVLAQDAELDAGVYNFEVWRAHIHGRIRWTVQARARSPARFGSDLVSLERVFYPLLSPHTVEHFYVPPTIPVPPPSLQVHIEGHYEQLGPYAIELQSQHMVVGGLILARVYLPSPPQDLYLHSIRLSLKQQYRLTSPSNPSRKADAPLASHTIFIVDGESPENGAEPEDDGRGAARRNPSPFAPPLRRVPQGEPCEIVHLARMPNDNRLRPTTHEGTKTPLQCETWVEVEVLYRADEEGVGGRDSSVVGAGREKGKGKNVKGKGKEVKKEDEPELRVMRLTKPVHLFSCLNHLDALTLPRYNAQDPHPLSSFTSGDGSTGLDVNVPCACGLTLNELLSKHANLLVAANRRRRNSAQTSSTRPLFTLPSPSPSSPSTQPRKAASGSGSALDDREGGEGAAVKPLEQRMALSPAVTFSRWTGSEEAVDLLGAWTGVEAELEVVAAGAEGEQREGEVEGCEKGKE
ncbi:hypothetical protein JCM10207_006168 [Rhodosporidiobolus poonsookiae]